MNKNWILTLAFAMANSSSSMAQSVYPGSPQSLQDASLPPTIRVAFRMKPLKDAYTPDFGINPFYVQGDFDGDKRLDVAVFIAERTNKRKGIAVIHASGPVSVLGAGKVVMSRMATLRPLP
ncbi:MAG: hypothetical protein AAB036_08445, partial [Elusimicrobiota bacterium]